MSELGKVENVEVESWIIWYKRKHWYVLSMLEVFLLSFLHCWRVNPEPWAYHTRTLVLVRNFNLHEVPNSKGLDKG